MKRRSILLSSLFVVLMILGYAVYRQNQKSKIREREAHIISIYYLALQTTNQNFDERPKNIEELLMEFGGSGAVILEPFDDGLRFEATSSGFILEEPVRHAMANGDEDRLIATEQKWPYWEVSGEKAKKYGVEIPSQ